MLGILYFVLIRKVTLSKLIFLSIPHKNFRPHLYGLGYPRQPSLPRQLYRACLYEKKIVPASRVKVEFLSFIRSVWALLSLFCFCNVHLCFNNTAPVNTRI